MKQIDHPVTYERALPSRGDDSAPSRGVRRVASGLLLLAVVVLSTACTGVSKPGGWAAPVSLNDLILISNKDGSLSAVRVPQDPAAKPSVVWTYPTEGKLKKQYVAFYATPLVGRVGDGQRVFVAAYSGDVLALDPGNGQPVGGWPKSAQVGGHIAATPAFDGKTLYVATSNGDIKPVDATSGAVGKALVHTSSRAWSTPIVQGGRLYAGSLDHHLRAIDLASGQVEWDRDVGGAIGGDPALTGDLLLVPTLQSRLAALSLSAQGEERWHFDGDNWFWAKPLVADRTVYTVSAIGTVYALDLDSGAERWHASVGSEVRATPALVAGTLVIAANNGTITGLDSATGTQRWQQTQTDARFLADPLVRDASVLYIADNGALVRVRPQDQGTLELLFQHGK